MKTRKIFSEKNLFIDSKSLKRLTLSKSSHSIISSPRIAYFRKEQHLKQPKILQKQQLNKQTQQQILIFTRSDDIMNEIVSFPLQCKLVHYSRQRETQQKEIIVVTKIAQFYSNYNQYFNQLNSTFSSIHWIILSNAINNKQTEEQFNIEYQPIKFALLKNIAEFVNLINFKAAQHLRQDKCLTFFKGIINFGAYTNQNAVILEQNLDQKLISLKQKCRSRYKIEGELWILSKQQLLKLKDMKCHLYIITQGNIINKSMKLPISTTSNILYILHQNYDSILSSLGIKQLEQKLSKQQIKQISARVNNEEYDQKIICKYFKGEIIYNVIAFPQEIIVKFQQCMTNNLVLAERNLQSRLGQESNIFNVYFDSKDDQDDDDIFGYQLKANCQHLQQHIGKINKYYQSVLQLRGNYHQIRPFVSQYTIILYNIPQIKTISKQIHYFTSKNTCQITTLQNINDFHSQKVILISKPLNNKKSLISPQLNIHLIQINARQRQVDKINLHRKIIQLVSKLNKEELLNHEKLEIKKVLNFCVSLKIEKNLVQDYSNGDTKLQKFKQILVNLKNNNKYMIILSMEEYNEEKQRFLKELQLIKNVIFEVYLEYGNQFIFRGKHNKYNFYKKSQIVQKINTLKQSTDTGSDTYYFAQTSKDKKQSDITYNHHYEKKGTFSTPNLYNHENSHNEKEILICLPKSVPTHSLVNRSSKAYTILIYNNPTQIKQLLNNLTSQYYVIIINVGQDFIHKNNRKQKNYEYIKIKDLSQKLIRQQIDRIIQRFNLIKKVNQFQKKDKELPAVLLYDQSNQKQIKSIQKINNIFKNVKIIVMAKSQFKNIVKYYKIYDISIYEMGKNEIQCKSTSIIHNIVELFKLYMSPCVPHSQYTFQRSVFSAKGIFIKSFIEYNKSFKILGKAKSEINFYQQTARNKSIIQKQYVFNQSGMAILQSKDLNILNKKQKFGHHSQLLELCVTNIHKGNQICILVSQDMFSEIKYYIDVYNRQFVWIILVQDLKKCIIKESNLIFIQKHQIQQTISKVIQQFREFKNRMLQLFHKNLVIQQKEDELKVIFLYQKSNSQQRLQIIWDKKGFQYRNSDLKHVILIKNIRIFQNILLFLKQCMRNVKVTQKLISNAKKVIIQANNTNHDNNNIIYKYKNDQSVSVDEGQEGDGLNQKIMIVIKQRNKRFIEQTLKIIEERLCVLIVYEQIEELLEYNQLQKTFFIVQEDDNIHLKDCLIVQSSQTPLDFSHKLKNYIKGIRNIS